MSALKPSKAPSIPLASPTYSQQNNDQQNNSLRLYFNQVDNNTALLIQAVNSIETLQWLTDLS